MVEMVVTLTINALKMEEKSVIQIPTALVFHGTNLIAKFHGKDKD
jgi:hypothetical protein